MLRTLIATLVAVTAFPVLAAQRTFVASTGSDLSPCSLTQPCRSFAAAIAQTNPAGEVIALDSAGYGSVVIAQSVSIIAPAGVYAGITVATGAGVSVNGAGIVVKLEGLTINGQGGSYGIQALDAARLQIVRCEIANMLTAGISSSVAGLKIDVQRSVSRNNAQDGAYLAGASALIEDSKFEANFANGIYLRDATNATLNGVTASGNADGIRIETQAGQTTKAQLDRVHSRGNTSNGVVGVSAGNGNAFVDIARSTIGFNHDGITATSGGAPGGVYVSLTSNVVSDNGVYGITAVGVNAAVIATSNTVQRNGIGMSASGGAVFQSALDNSAYFNLGMNTSGVTSYTKN